MPGAGEDAHVGADLSDDRFGGALGDAGDRRCQPDAGLSGRAQLGLDRAGELGDVLVEEVQMRQDRADDQRVVGLEAALQRFAQRNCSYGTVPCTSCSNGYVYGTRTERHSACGGTGKLKCQMCNGTGYR